LGFEVYLSLSRLLGVDHLRDVVNFRLFGLDPCFRVLAFGFSGSGIQDSDSSFRVSGLPCQQAWGFGIRFSGFEMRHSDSGLQISGLPSQKAWGFGFRDSKSGFWDSGFGFRVSGSGFRDLGFGLTVLTASLSSSAACITCSRVSGSGFRIFGFEFRGSGFRFQGSEFLVLGFGFRVSGVDHTEFRVKRYATAGCGVLSLGFRFPILVFRVPEFNFGFRVRKFEFPNFGFLAPGFGQSRVSDVGD